MNRLFPILLICIAFSCNESTNRTTCIQAEFVVAEMCSNFIVIDVKDNQNIGVPLVDYSGKHHTNAIKVVGGSVFPGLHDYRIREFDVHRDAHFNDQGHIVCPALYGPLAVPVYVIEATTCPD